MFTFGDQLTQHLGQGLADNWSQVSARSEGDWDKQHCISCLILYSALHSHHIMSVVYSWYPSARLLPFPSTHRSVWHLLSPHASSSCLCHLPPGNVSFPHSSPASVSTGRCALDIVTAAGCMDKILGCVAKAWVGLSDFCIFWGFR